MKKQKKKITAYVLLVLLIIVIFVIRDNFFENGLLKKIYNEKATFTILKYPFITFSINFSDIESSHILFIFFFTDSKF